MNDERGGSGGDDDGGDDDDGDGSSRGKSGGSLTAVATAAVGRTAVATAAVERTGVVTAAVRTTTGAGGGSNADDGGFSFPSVSHLFPLYIPRLPFRTPSFLLLCLLFLRSRSKLPAHLSSL